MQLTVATFNVENLFTTPSLEFPDRPLKPESKLIELGQAIDQMQADLIGLCEVGSLQDLQYFLDRYVQTPYTAICHRGHSDRGIELAYLIGKKIPGPWRVDTHLHLDFSRDVLKLQLPAMTFYLVHLKSRLDKDGTDFEGKKKRAQEVLLLTTLLEKEQGPAILMGDFNGHYDEEREFHPLREKLGWRDVLSFLPTEADKGTHTFFRPGQANPQVEQIDYLLLSPFWWDKVDPSLSGVAKLWPSPTTLQEKFFRPSDHYPVIGTFHLP